jgi:K+-transporting ATPase ATPase C chain
MKSWIADLRISILLTLILVVLCCGIYPALVWGVAHLAFPEKAAGSLVHENGKLVGSRLIGQQFSSPAYFHPRQSAAGSGYDATASGGTNLGPLSKKLIEDVRRRVIAYRQENSLSKDAPVPADAVTSSASGLDPHISVENARLQAGRVAEARHASVEVVMNMVKRHTRGRTFGLLGEPRVNVLELNLDLDRRFGKGGHP